MTEISFYVLASDSSTQRLQFACRLLEKAYRSGQFCYVLTDSEEQSQSIDDMLWSFRAGSFVPHEIYTGTLPVLETCILIGTLAVPNGWHNNLLNLSTQCPDNFERFKRIFEVLDDSEIGRTGGRLRYSFYKKSGFTPIVHKIPA